MGFFPRIRGRLKLGRWTIFAFSTLCLIIIEIIYYWLDEHMVSDLEEFGLLVGLALQIVIGILIAQGNWKMHSIERAQLKKQIASQNAAKKVEHERIARYLHDTLGHNLAYLRLKLDQLSGEDAIRNIVLIQREIERMRDVADLAYEQMRNSLSDLREEPIPELSAAIDEYATAISDRADFQVRFQTEGETRSIPAHLQRKILYILREALRNIEKHAHASLVRIQMIWTEDNLTLVVKDNGIGFDLEAARERPGHYGLKIMQECAQEINAHLVIGSQENLYTKITLTLPLKQQTSERTHLLFSERGEWLAHELAQSPAGDQSIRQSAFEGNQ